MVGKHTRALGSDNYGSKSYFKGFRKIIRRYYWRRRHFYVPDFFRLLIETCFREENTGVLLEMLSVPQTNLARLKWRTRVTFNIVIRGLRRICYGTIYTFKAQNRTLVIQSNLHDRIGYFLLFWMCSNNIFRSYNLIYLQVC
jgi:hypothetical protein